MLIAYRQAGSPQAKSGQKLLINDVSHNKIIRTRAGERGYGLCGLRLSIEYTCT
jgi:hypothetical protein